MDLGLVTGLAALCGVLCNFIRLGEWKARQETKVENLEKRIEAFDHTLSDLLSKNDYQTQLLTELKVKLDMIFNDKKGRKKND